MLEKLEFTIRAKGTMYVTINRRLHGCVFFCLFKLIWTHEAKLFHFMLGNIKYSHVNLCRFEVISIVNKIISVSSWILCNVFIFLNDIIETPIKEKQRTCSKDFALDINTLYV